MMKPKEIGWHAYISQSPYVTWQNTDDYAKFIALSQCLSKMYSLYHGNLLTKNVAKQIICEPTQPAAIYQGHPPYCFRFQCLTTGRVSKFIKERDYASFGITEDDARLGVGYKTREQIVDKFKPTITRIQAKMQSLYAAVANGSDWWSRYSEYLASEEWSAIRETVLARDHNQCVITGKHWRLHVHHVTYDRVGMEHPSDLVTVEQDTHKQIHDKEHPDRNSHLAKIASYLSAMYRK